MICYDLFCGLGGWTEGFLAEGYTVYGFDNICRPYPGIFVEQDVLDIKYRAGNIQRFLVPDIIVASPPCQTYSWLSMPWSHAHNSTAPNLERAKAVRRQWERFGPDNKLFDVCWRIKHEASLLAGRDIPLIVENVRGAQEWVGKSSYHFGSFYLWGDIPPVMPIGKAVKQPGDWFNDPLSDCGRFGSKSPERAASAALKAKIPLQLAQHIARYYRLNLSPENFIRHEIENSDGVLPRFTSTVESLCIEKVYLEVLAGL
jgi:C-5 cytosine-specific DNA methylase